MYSLIVGEVINIHIRKDCLEPEISIEKDVGGGNGTGDGVRNRCVYVDLEKVRPVARLGYGQEYTVVLED